MLENIVVVGGGTAGWMTASTLIGSFPNKKITLIESPDIKTVGVGESTVGGINNWMQLLNINDYDFMSHCDSTYKLSIRFEDFYQKGSGGFHYPFGRPVVSDYVNGVNDWYFKRMLYPETTITDYADVFYPNMALVNQNKIFKNEDNELDSFDFVTDSAYQFDATKFAIWLKDYYCKHKGINHILSEVNEVKSGEDGIEFLSLKNGERITADLFIDCTGFSSLLIEKALHEPFESLEHLLPNNSAWATKIPYQDKRKELVSYTNCHAINNGWVWNIPLWSRIGSGYVYSDKYISDDDALIEFKNHLGERGNDLDYKKIKFRSGIHRNLWVKNVCAIGMSAGFIEPLESNGLYTIHEFLLFLIRVIDRGKVSQWDKDTFNFSCKSMFKEFSEFVVLHYALSHRDDTPYWKENFNRSYSSEIYNNYKLPSIYGFTSAVYNKFRQYKFKDFSGLACIATGMNWHPTDIHSVRYGNANYNFDLEERFDHSIFLMESRKKSWNKIVSTKQDHYDFLKEHYYT